MPAELELRLHCDVSALDKFVADLTAKVGAGTIDTPDPPENMVRIVEKRVGGKLILCAVPTPELRRWARKVEKKAQRRRA